MRFFDCLFVFVLSICTMLSAYGYGNRRMDLGNDQAFVKHNVNGKDIVDEGLEKAKIDEQNTFDGKIKEKQSTISIDKYESRKRTTNRKSILENYFEKMYSRGETDLNRRVSKENQKQRAKLKERKQLRELVKEDEKNSKKLKRILADRKLNPKDRKKLLKKFKKRKIKTHEKRVKHLDNRLRGIKKEKGKSKNDKKSQKKTKVEKIIEKQKRVKEKDKRKKAENIKSKHETDHFFEKESNKIEKMEKPDDRHDIRERKEPASSKNHNENGKKYYKNHTNKFRTIFNKKKLTKEFKHSVSLSKLKHGEAMRNTNIKETLHSQLKQHHFTYLHKERYSRIEGKYSSKLFHPTKAKPQNYLETPKINKFKSKDVNNGKYKMLNITLAHDRAYSTKRAFKYYTRLMSTCASILRSIRHTHPGGTRRTSIRNRVSKMCVDIRKKYEGHLANEARARLTGFPGELKNSSKIDCNIIDEFLNKSRIENSTIFDRLFLKKSHRKSTALRSNNSAENLLIKTINSYRIGEDAKPSDSNDDFKKHLLRYLRLYPELGLLGELSNEAMEQLINNSTFSLEKQIKNKELLKRIKMLPSSTEALDLTQDNFKKFWEPLYKVKNVSTQKYRYITLRHLYSETDTDEVEEGNSWPLADLVERGKKAPSIDRTEEFHTIRQPSLNDNPLRHEIKDERLYDVSYISGALDDILEYYEAFYAEHNLTRVQGKLNVTDHEFNFDSSPAFSDPGMYNKTGDFFASNEHHKVVFADEDTTVYAHKSSINAAKFHIMHTPGYPYPDQDTDEYNRNYGWDSREFSLKSALVRFDKRN